MIGVPWLRASGILGVLRLEGLAAKVFQGSECRVFGPRRRRMLFRVLLSTQYLRFTFCRVSGFYRDALHS